MNKVLYTANEEEASLFTAYINEITTINNELNKKFEELKEVSKAFEVLHQKAYYRDISERINAGEVMEHIDPPTPVADERGNTLINFDPTTNDMIYIGGGEL